MKILKLIIMQAMMITFGIVAVIGISLAVEHYSGAEVWQMEWYHPLSYIFTGILGAIPTVVWQNLESLSKKQFIVRLILHCIVLYAVVMACGYFFKWYTELSGFIGVSISFLLIYGFVWAATIFGFKQDEKQLNAAIDQIRDEE
ncbi:MAG: DUF3021 family protein [Lachnospiraceae bacterium]|nr:DUF3021 family protein [Lachnospiraceae bacterium]